MLTCYDCSKHFECLSKHTAPFLKIKLTDPACSRFESKVVNFTTSTKNNEKKSMTNAEKIRSMPDEDLASFLSYIGACCQGVGYFQKPDKDCCTAMHCPIASFISDETTTCGVYDILQYLRSEASE